MSGTRKLLQSLLLGNKLTTLINEIQQMIFYFYIGSTVTHR